MAWSSHPLRVQRSSYAFGVVGNHCEIGVGRLIGFAAPCSQSRSVPIGIR